MAKRIGIYLRVSTQGQNTELQRSEIESFLIAKGWSNKKVFEDHATGTNANRPGLKALMSEVRDCKIDIVITWKMDRLFRSLRDLVSTLEEFRQRNVDYISVKDQIDMTTPAGILLTHLLGSFAQFESSLTKDRVIAGLENAKRKGIRLGRPPVINTDLILRLNASGLSLGQISMRTGYSKSAIHKYLKKLRSQRVEKSELQIVEIETDRPSLLTDAGGLSPPENTTVESTTNEEQPINCNLPPVKRD